MEGVFCLPWLPFCFQISPMTSTATKPWVALLATGGLMLGTSLIALPARAQTPCVNGLLISTILNAGSGGYTCYLGEMRYTFNDSLSELNNTTSTSYVNFYNSGDFQEVAFLNTAAPDAVYFDYKILSPIETIDAIDLSFTQTPASPPPLTVEATGSPVLPADPSPINPTTITVLFDPDTSLGPQTLTSLTQKIYKSPAPLPLAGAGVFFGFSRKLRRRIGQASRKGISG
jgi:hypothetical protein